MTCISEHLHRHHLHFTYKSKLFVSLPTANRLQELVLHHLYEENHLNSADQPPEGICYSDVYHEGDLRRDKPVYIQWR